MNRSGGEEKERGIVKPCGELRSHWVKGIAGKRRGRIQDFKDAKKGKSQL